jgi:23S rRNA (uracil1939-C5)-methyltransferase
VSDADRKSGDVVDVHCGPLVHGGVCLAHPDSSTTVLVEGAIPGERVEAVLRFRKGNTWFARTTRVLDTSPHRVDPPCPYVPDCGGCQLQHISYAHQLELKREVLRDALRRQGIAAGEVHVTGMTDPWRYRWRGEFHVIRSREGGAGVELGFNRARSWKPIAVDDCSIHHRRITDSLPLLRDMARAGAAELSTLHLTIGAGGDELLVRGKPRTALSAGAIDAASLRMKAGGRLSAESTSLEWRGHSYRVTPEAFIQVNWVQMDALYSAVIRGLNDVVDKRIVDAYAGIGVLAVHLATEASEVVCIESNRNAARIGVLNARLNEVAGRLRYVLAPVERGLPAVAAEAPVDCLILDPPRAGCGGRVTGWIALAGPERVVYVSCDPATLARDLHVLVASGPYRIDRLEVVDMFPQTYHIESVLTLVRT